MSESDTKVVATFDTSIEKTAEGGDIQIEAVKEAAVTSTTPVAAVSTVEENASVVKDSDIAPATTAATTEKAAIVEENVANMSAVAGESIIKKVGKDLQKVIPVTTNKSAEKGEEEKNKKSGHSNNIHHAHHAHLKIDESKTVKVGSKIMHLGDAHGHHASTVTMTESSEIEQLTSNQELIAYLKAQVSVVLESSYVAVVMAIITVWALFSDDLRLAATDKTADLGFTIVISIAFFLFVLEILAASFCKDDYLVIPDPTMREGETVLSNAKRRLTGFGSFYFWLDIIATVSLIFEISWMGLDISGNGDRSSEAGNASRAGARAGRIIRLVRMVRLVRLVKLYKYTAKFSKKKEEENVIEGNEDHEDEVMGAESRVGAAMTDLTNRRVIVLVLIMLIIIPLLNVIDTNQEAKLAVEFVYALLVGKAASSSNYSAALNKAIANIVSNTEIVSLAIYMNGSLQSESFTNTDKIDLLRSSEMDSYQTGSQDTYYVKMTFDKSSSTREDALYAIYTTLFVVFLLMGATLYFSHDVNHLVIGPIERMVELVQKISANPLGVEYKMLGEEDGFVEGMETTTLLATITKIGRLMKVGFGEAGASVIGKNMSGAGNRLKLLGGGTMIHSIFGFCDVRQFTDTTECLQEEVMLFVNRIGHILHSIVVQCAGAANKNIGDAFLLTWKLEEKWNAKETSSAADQALLCFCKALVELGRYEEFIVNFTAASTARLYKRFPGYHVRIGSGLHVGWAIEGAIGSNRKIDASYLSPHVNFTEFLESSTKAYGTPLLISEPFYKLLSPASAKYIRQVDRIRKSAREEPMNLYTYDSDLTIDWADPNRKLISKRLMPTLKAITGKFKNAGRRASIGAAARLAMTPEDIAAQEELKKKKADAEAAEKAENDKKLQTPTITLKPYSEDIWRGDPDLVDLRHRVNDKFRQNFKIGIENYISGNWVKAKEIFEHMISLSLNNGAPDGPSSFLLKTMEDLGSNGQSPASWQGYREAFD